MHSAVAHNQSIPQLEHYKDITFNLEAEPPANIYSDSDDDDEYNASKDFMSMIICCLIDIVQTSFIYFTPFSY